MSLRSDSSIHIVDLISEGPITGLAGSVEDSVFLDDTPLSQYKSIDNAVDLTLGGKNQRPPLSLLGQDASLDTVQNIGVEVGSNYEETVDSENRVISRNYGEGFVVRSVTDTTVKKVSLLITVNRLFSTAIEGLGRGQLFNATVRLGITFYGPLGFAHQSVAAGTEFNITGITTSGYQFKTPQYDISRFGYPCFIRLHKFKNIRVQDNNNYRPQDLSRGTGVPANTPEAAFEATYLTLTETPEPERLALASGRGNQVTWSQLILHKPTHVNYAHSACAALTINTKDISSLPTRSYLIKGIKVPIPSNMATRDDGSLRPVFGTDFDGTAKAAEWTTCPVCIWRHMLLNTRFGAGDFVSAENVSWVDLYPLIRYANELVLIDPVQSTYSENFVDSITGETRFNITIGSNHGYVPGDIIHVFFTSGDLLLIHDVCSYEVRAINATQVAVIPYATQLGNTAAGGSVGGSCLTAKQVEPRFACNTVISNQAQAFDVLQDLASIFRGMMYWQTNGITATADHGELFKSGGLDNNVPSVHLFSNSNVVDGQFDYETSSVKTRSTSLKVRYNSPENNYRPDTICVEDPELRDKYGHQVREIVAFGCTSRTQAARMGRWMLASEKLAGNLIKFSTGLDGAVVLPGQVFSVADEMRAGNRYSGRVRASTIGTITLDRNLNLPPGSNLEITCTLEDGLVETRSATATSVVNGYTVITVGILWAKVPPAGSIYSLSTDSVNEQKFRCVSISDNGDGTYGIVGVQHNDSIYAVADVAGNSLEPLKISSFTDFPARPTAVKVTFRPVQVNGNLFFQMLISWERGATGVTVEYEARIFVNNQPFKKITTDQQFIKLDTESLVRPNTEVTVTIVAKGLKFGEISPSERITTIAPSAQIAQSVKSSPAEDKVVLPPDILGMAVRRMDETSARIEYDPVQNENLDQLRLVVRVSTASDGGSWGRSVLVQEFPVAANDIIVPYLLRFAGDVETGAKYYVKLKDTRTNAQSANAAAADVQDISPIDKYTETIEETNANPSLNLKGIRSKTVTKVADGLILQSRFVEESLTGETEQNINRSATGTYEQTVVTSAPPFPVTTGTIVVTLNNHPFIVGDYVNLELNGIKNNSAPYKIEAVTTNTFTVTSKDSVPVAIPAGALVTVFKSASSGTYFFDNELDLGGNYEVLLSSVIENDTTDTNGVTSAKLYYRTNNLDSQLTETGGIVDETGSDFVLLEDGGEIVVESFVEFTPWKPFIKTFATGRAFQFKLELIGKYSRTPVISKLGVKAQLLERTEVGIVSPGVLPADNMFEFTNAFYKKPEGTTGKMTGEVKVDQTTTIQGTTVTGLVSVPTHKAQIFPFTPFLADLTQVPEGRAFHANVLDLNNAVVGNLKIEYTATGFGKKLT